MNNWYMTERLVKEHHTALLQERARDRLVNSAIPASESMVLSAQHTTPTSQLKRFWFNLKAILERPARI